MNEGLRFKILNRDDFKCYYCGAEAPDVKLEVDHLLPVDKGGGDNEDNLVTACYECNRSKGNILTGREKKRDLDKLRKKYKWSKTTHVRIRISLKNKLKMKALESGKTMQQLVEDIINKKLS